MIAVGIETGFVVYLFLLLGGVSALAIYENWRANSCRWSISEERLHRCDDCNYTFVVRRKEKIVRCPRCNKLCSIRGRR